MKEAVVLSGEGSSSMSLSRDRVEEKNVTMPKNKSDKSSVVKRRPPAATGALARGLLLMNVFHREVRPMSLTDIASEVNLDLSTVHRLLRTLGEHGYVVRDDRTKSYLPGPKALSPLSLFHPLNQLRHEARSVLESLRDSTNETIALVLFVGTERLVVDFVRGNHSLSPYYDAWLTSPLHGSASGKLLLAWKSDDERHKMMGTAPYPKVTSHTVTETAAFFDYLNQVRLQGYAVARDDAFEGLIAIGSVLMHRHEGVPLGCVVMTGASDSVSAKAEVEIANSIQAATALLIGSAPSLQALRQWV
ncbi:putative transcriptional regulator [Pusillimonas sp. T7-7]|uniref:IclR family transcriptional regulator n=1 Tax=Pusillimonas sp. (strain T7-7) TaxID=1007105 RepID=UPI00020848BF|nr:IclR family transcriptional regulator [Pusillimonas sp. T7-7]AEC21007.1 putative transcriptional regulator [Pusillimonas sp. T7-7]